MSARDTSTRPDVCLVNMPVFYLQCPSLSLGLLKALVQRAGFSARVVYANLSYADTMAPRTLALMRTRSKFLGEWLFGGDVFPGRDPNGWRRLGSADSSLPVGEDDEEERRAVAAAQDEADRFITWQAIEILEYSPRIVGCTSSGVQHLPALALLKRIRELRPEVITMMGGPNCEEERGVATHRLFSWVDYVVSGDADDLIGPLLSRILSGDRDLRTGALPEGVFGPAHRQIGYPRSPDGGAPRAVARSMARSPVPDYAEYFETLSASKRLRTSVNPHIPIETSRGCWWAVSRRPCSFCGVNGVREAYAVKPPARTLSELDTLHERHGVSRFAFNDNMMSKSYFRTLLPELKERGRPYRIFGQMTARLAEDEIRLLGESGFEMVQPGIETLHTKALDALRKPTQAWQNVQTLKWCAQYGVATTWALLSDIPGERDEWYQEMADLVPLLTHLSPPRQVGRIYFSRNSEYQRCAEQYGLTLEPDEDASILYPVGRSDLQEMAVIFQDAERERRFKDDMRFLFQPGLEALRREIERWRAAYFSPSRPSLTMDDRGAALRICDTRRVAVQPMTELTGLERDVYLECWAAPTEPTLLERFQDRRTAPGDVRAVLDSLAERKIVVAIDGRWLALATRHPVRRVSDEPWFEPTASEWSTETEQPEACKV